MKLFIFSSVILFALICASSSDIMDQWKQYKEKHNKTYDEAEDVTRLENFQRTLKTIEEHNAKYETKEVSFKMGLNAMSDWTTEEKARLHGGKIDSQN